VRGSVETIPEKLVEETWQEVASFSPDQMRKGMTKLSRGQPYLTAFMMEFVQDLEQEVKELAVYMFFVVYQMFQKSFERKIKRISAENIIDCYEQNENLMQGMEGIHEKFFERISRVQLSGQPYVLKYVVETLIEAPEEEDPIELTEEDVGFLFLLLKTVVDVVDKQE